MFEEHQPKHELMNKMKQKKTMTWQSRTNKYFCNKQQKMKQTLHLNNKYNMELKYYEASWTLKMYNI